MVMLSTKMRRKLARKEKASRANLSESNPADWSLVASKTDSHESAVPRLDLSEARRMFRVTEQSGTIAFIELLDAGDAYSLNTCSSDNEPPARESLANVDENENELEVSAASEEPLEPAFWTPDADQRYGPAHQAALESALSSVLNVSTLVGFRVPEPSRKEHQVNSIPRRATKVSY